MKDKENMHWVFDDNADDVRGWPVHENDVLLGTVDELLVDPETSYVTAVQLSDGTRVSAERVQIGDNVLLVTKSTSAEPKAEIRGVQKGVQKTEPQGVPKQGVPKPEPQAAVKPAPTVAPEAKPQVSSTTSSSYAQSATPAAMASASSAVTPTDDITIDLASEEIEVGKRRFDAGGVHLESHVVAETIGRDVKLKGEHVTVEREKQDRVLSASDAEKFFHDDAYEVKARAEVPIVKKSARVVEELVIKKADTQHDEIIRETIRQMDAAITEIAADVSPPRGKQGGVR